MPAEPAAHLWSASILPRRRSRSSPGWCLHSNTDCMALRCQRWMESQLNVNHCLFVTRRPGDSVQLGAILLCLKTVLAAAINSLSVDLLIDLLLLFNRKQPFFYELKKNAPKTYLYIFCYLCSLRTHCSSLPQYRFQCVYILYRHKLFVEVLFGLHRLSHEQKHLMLLVLPIVIYIYIFFSVVFHFKNLSEI